MTWEPEARCKLWANLSPNQYRLYEAGESTADVREGMDDMGGIWARERYEWRDGGAYIRSTTVEINLMNNGVVEVWISERDGGQAGTKQRIVSTRRPARGLKGKLVGVVFGLMWRKMFTDAHRKNHESLRANCREMLGLNPDGTPASEPAPATTT